MMMVQASFYQGRWHDVIAYGASLERIYEPALHDGLRDRYSLDVLLVWQVHGAQAWWMLGERGKAFALAETAAARAKAIGHLHSRVWATVWGANLHLMAAAPARWRIRSRRRPRSLRRRGSNTCRASAN